MKNTDHEMEEKRWKKEFSDTLNKLLSDNGISINQLANVIETDPKTIRNYINQKSIPTAIILMKIADYFNVSVDYLVTGGKTGLTYSARTIRELATLIGNFDIKLNHPDNDNAYYQSVSLTVNDPILASIITELCMTSEKDFRHHVEQVASAYGDLKVFRQRFVDYGTFQNLIKDRYIFDDFDDLDSFTAEDELNSRREKWEKMSLFEREQWWQNWLEEHDLIN